MIDVKQEGGESFIGNKGNTIHEIDNVLSLEIILNRIDRILFQTNFSISRVSRKLIPTFFFFLIEIKIVIRIRIQTFSNRWKIILQLSKSTYPIPTSSPLQILKSVANILKPIGSNFFKRHRNIALIKLSTTRPSVNVYATKSSIFSSLKLWRNLSRFNFFHGTNLYSAQTSSKQRRRRRRRRPWL